MSEKKADDLRSEELVGVWNAPDEAAGVAVAAFLREQGIEATAVPVQIAWFADLQTLHHGYWGKVEVMAHDAERARALVEDFLKAVPEEAPDTGETEGPGS
jgi:hypothetical protein